MSLSMSGRMAVHAKPGDVEPIGSVVPFVMMGVKVAWSRLASALVACQRFLDSPAPDCMSQCAPGLDEIGIGKSILVDRPPHHGLVFFVGPPGNVIRLALRALVVSSPCCEMLLACQMLFQRCLSTWRFCPFSMPFVFARPAFSSLLSKVADGLGFFAFGAVPDSMTGHAFPPVRGKVFEPGRPFRPGSPYAMGIEGALQCR